MWRSAIFRATASPACRGACPRQRRKRAAAGADTRLLKRQRVAGVRAAYPSIPLLALRATPATPHCHLKAPIELELDFAVEEAAVFVAQWKRAGDAEAGGLEEQHLHADCGVEHVEAAIGVVNRKQRVVADSDELIRVGQRGCVV